MKVEELSGSVTVWSPGGPVEMLVYHFAVQVNGVDYSFHQLGTSPRMAALSLATNLEIMRNDLLVSFGTGEGKAN